MAFLRLTIVHYPFTLSLFLFWKRIFYGNKSQLLRTWICVILLNILLPYLKKSQKPFKWKELFHYYHSMILKGDTNTILTYKCVYVRASVYACFKYKNTEMHVHTHESDPN